MDSNNDATIDPDNTSNGTDDPIEDDSVLPGKVLLMNDGFAEGKRDGSSNPVADMSDPSPVHSNGLELVLEGMVPCSSAVLPVADPDAVIMLASLNGLVRVLAINPGAAPPYKMGEDWTVVPFAASLTVDYFVEGGVYFGWQWWIEGIAPGDDRLTLDHQGANAQCSDVIRVTVIGLSVLDGSESPVKYLRIGHWGADTTTASGPGVSGYDPVVGVPINGASGTFIESGPGDPDRFKIRVANPLRNADPNAADLALAWISTLNESSGVDDDETLISLQETGPDTGVFDSEWQLLMSPDLPSGDSPDDDLPVYSEQQAGTVADDVLYDRTHRVTIDESLHVRYVVISGTAAEFEQDRHVCQRAPIDERQTVRLRVHVFNEPFDDVGADGMPGTGDAGEGNGTYDFGEPHREISGDGIRNTVLGPEATAEAFVAAHLVRAVIAWAQACIKVEQVGATIFEEAPLDANGVNIMDDGFFTPVGFDGATVIQQSSGAVPHVAEVFIVADMPDNAVGFSWTPDVMDGSMLDQWDENSYIFIANDAPINMRTLAHELGHALTNGEDSNTPAHIFYPSHNVTETDDQPFLLLYRRITQATENIARTCRPPGSPGDDGSRILSGCP